MTLRCRFFFPLFFFTKVHLLVEARSQWSVTQTIMWLSLVSLRPFGALDCVSLRLSPLSLSLSLPLSQAKGCSCRCHMMSCGPVVVAEQWQFYPCAIWSTRHSLSHAHTLPVSVCVWASLYDHKSGHRQYQPSAMCSCLCLWYTVQRLHSLVWKCHLPPVLNHDYYCFGLFLSNNLTSNGQKISEVSIWEKSLDYKTADRMNSRCFFSRSTLKWTSVPSASSSAKRHSSTLFCWP